MNDATDAGPTHGAGCIILLGASVNEYLGPKHPIWNGTFLAIALPATAIVLGALWVLWQNSLAVYAGLDPVSDAARIHLLGAVGLAGLLGLAIGVASVIGHVVHRRAVRAWLARQVSLEALRFFEVRFGAETKEYCYNPLAPCNFVLAIEYFASEGLLRATKGTKAILSRFRDSLNDVKPNLGSYHSHSCNARRILLALQTAMRNQVLRLQTKSLPKWVSGDNGNLTFPSLAATAERITADFRLNVYDLLNRNPSTDAEAGDLIYKAKVNSHAICTQLDSHRGDLERLRGLVEFQFRHNRVMALANRRTCRPPGTGKHAILAAACK